jgi:hypothetical protein
MYRILSILLALSISFSVSAQVAVSGEQKKWHKITLTIDGPKTDEQHDYNPFLNYRMDVTFHHDSVTYVVPGYFAADGDAGNTSATSGNKWQAHLSPDFTGKWTYRVSFRKGANVAVADNPREGEAVHKVDGLSGSFQVSNTDKTGLDLRGKGRLLFHNRQYPVWAETGEYFYKNGTDAPENLLSYADFDGTFHNDGHKDNLVKTWEPHLKDWSPGDPTWKDGKGKALIGAINYLASEGLNAFSFLTLNIIGDDQNVFPYVIYDNYERIDISKMDQWEAVFEHGDHMGMFLHFKTGEVENQTLLDGGDVGVQRKLYYRELIARFGHHLALNWNMGEENGKWGKQWKKPYQTTEQRLDMARYFFENDPYRHHVVIHNGQQYYDLLGPDSKYTGISLQTSKPDFRQVYPATRRWVDLSGNQFNQWAVAVDEPGDAQHSLLPDEDDAKHDMARQNALWGSLMAGAWGTEWYFGYKHAHSDLSCEDWRSRDLFWDQCRYLLEFIDKENVPLPDMKPANELTSGDQDWVLAKENDTYLVLLKLGKKPANQLKVGAGNYSVRWLNPRTGEFAGKAGKSKSGMVDLSKPPSEVEMDWVVLVERE